MSDKPITEMNASFNYIFDRLCMSYPASEARAIARLVLETRFGLTPIDICMGRDRTFSLEERRDLENIVKRLSQKRTCTICFRTNGFLRPYFLRCPGCSCAASRDGRIDGVDHTGRKKHPDFHRPTYWTSGRAAAA